jgi:hypothetical protein
MSFLRGRKANHRLARTPRADSGGRFFDCAPFGGPTEGWPYAQDAQSRLNLVLLSKHLVTCARVISESYYREKERKMPRVSLNQVAPDFTLADYRGKTVRLADFRGSKNVLLVFNRTFK